MWGSIRCAQERARQTTGGRRNGTNRNSCDCFLSEPASCAGQVSRRVLGMCSAARCQYLALLWLRDVGYMGGLYSENECLYVLMPVVSESTLRSEKPASVMVFRFLELTLLISQEVR